MNVKIKLLSKEAVIPKRGRKGDAGLDITATSVNETTDYIEYGTDLSIAVPEGYAGMLYPRSSLSNYELILSNHVGVLDSNYRGEIKFRFKKTGTKIYNVGDRIGQLVLHKIPEIVFEEVEELDETNRGDRGYGSSGL